MASKNKPEAKDLHQNAESLWGTNEEKFRIITGQTTDFIAITDANGFITYASPASASVFRVSPEEMCGRNFIEFVAEQGSQQAITEFNALMEHAGMIKNIEFLMNRSDGSSFIGEISGSRFQTGTQTGTMVTIRDITERNNTLKELAKSEERFRQVVEQSREVVWEVDANGLYTYVSPLATLVYGRTPEQIVGKMYFYDLYPADIREQNKKAAFEIFRRKESFHNFINTIAKPDGTLITLTTNGIPLLDANGDLIGYRGSESDITERIIAEEELRKFRTISDKANYGASISSLDGKFIYVNNAFANMLGWKANQLLGESYLSVHSEEQSPRVEELLALINHRGGFTSEEIFHTRKDGSTFPALMTANIIYNENHVPLYLASTTIDISKIKQVEETLKQSEQKYRSIFESVQDVYFVAAIDGTILEISPSIEIISKGQYSSDEMIGKPFAGVYKSAADRSLYYSKLFDQKGVTDYELSVRNKDGSLIPVAVSSVLVHDSEGKPAKVTGIIRDITERKQAEKKILELNANLEIRIAERTEQLDLVIKGSNDAPWDWNLVTNHHFYSLKWWQQIGYEPNEIPSDISIWKNLTHPDDFEQVNDTFEKALNSKNDTFEYEIRLQHKNGYYVPVLSRGFITRDINGKPIRVTGTNMDLTQRKRAEEEIVKAKNEAVKANLAKSEFLSRMSHELRTPMNSILGFAQLMDMGELNPKQKKGINHILTSGKHLLNLIDEVLEISRIETGRLSLFPEPVHLKGIIEEIMDTFHPLAKARLVKLVLENSPANQLFVLSDRKRLRQVLINLLSNAVKYNRPGGLISVKTESMPQNDAGIISARISVSDTGLGIASDDIPRLFNPFERIGAEKTHTEGAGLGLAIVKKIMDALNGSVGVESIFGEGSTFWIELPIIENRKNQTVQNEDALETGTGVSKKTGTILYIEDNFANVQLVEEILDSHRPKIQLIKTVFGKPAVKLASDHLPDLILLDLDLPDILGIDVLANLLADDTTKLIPVVIITADATQDQIEKLMTSGARDYLTKPLDVILFLQVVDEWIGMKK